MRATRRNLAATLALALPLVRAVAVAQDAGAGQPDASVPVASEAIAADVDAEEPSLDGDDEADLGPTCPGTGVVGVVRDAASGETLVEAPVSVVGRAETTLTDYDGRFALALPAGTHTLRARYDAYDAARLEGVRVTRGRCTEVEISLDASAMGDEVVIEVEGDRGSAATQLRLRRESAGVQDSIGAEEIARTPDSTASDAVRRVVGATVYDEYVLVRGLGGRYVSTTLNGIPLPSTDPDAQGVQLDIFPASLLEALTLRKTFTPELYGAWAGGLVALESRVFPRAFRLSAHVDLGLNTETIGRSLVGYPGGSLDFLGIDDGTRGLPASSRGLPIVGNGMPLSAADVDAIALDFADTWGVTRDTGVGDLGLSANLGDTLRLDNGMRLGFLLSGAYSFRTRRTSRTLVQTRFADGALEPRAALSQELVERSARLTLFGAASLELARQSEISLVTLVHHTGDHATGLVTGYSEQDAFDISRTRFDFLGRTLATAQLLGDHQRIAGPLRLRWALFGTVLDRYQPDVRDNLYRQTPGGMLAWREQVQSGERTWLDMGQLEGGASADLELPIERVFVGRIGGFARFATRSFETRRFRWSYDSADSTGALLPPEQLFSDARINEFLRLEERTDPDDSYAASTSLLAAHASVAWTFGPLRLLGGARVESYRQVLAPESPFDSAPATDAPTRTTVLDVLPAAAGAVELSSDLVLRAAYGGTVVRPELRELASFRFFDFVRFRNVQGNPALRRTFVHSFDLRLEWFLGPDEVVAASGFVKLFEDPVEPIIFDSNLSTQPGNTAGAQDFGGELEARVGLARIHEALRGLSVGANLTLVYSQVSLADAQVMQGVNPSRPLYGQSPWAINASLRYAPPGTGLDVGLFYNVFGPRLTDIGTMRRPDVYQEPVHQLDLVAGWEPVSGLLLQLRATNILHQRVSFRQGGIEILGYDPGTSFSLGATISTD